MPTIKNVKWKAFYVLSIILLGLFTLNRHVLAVEEYETWVIPDMPRNSFQETTQITADYIIQKGTHKKGTGTMNYRTTGYVMSLKEYDIKSPFNRSNTVDVPLYEKSDGGGAPGEVITLYTIEREKFLTAMVALGVTSAQIKQNGGFIKVYLNLNYSS